MKNKAISVVIPCYNEEKTIQKNLLKVHNYLKDRFGVFEIIVVNDGSNDGTLKEIKKMEDDLHLRIIDNQENKGKGKVVKQGILESSCDLVMFLDADLGIPIEELQKFVPEFDRGYDIIIASRFVPGLRVIRPVLWHRQTMEKIFRLLRLAIICDRNVKDTQCGFKCFTSDSAEKVFPLQKIAGWGFDVEILSLAKRLGFKIKQIPVVWVNDTESHVGASAYIKTLIETLRIRIWLWRDVYSIKAK